MKGKEIKKEMKIVLSFYKLAYAAAFVVILSVIRGVTYTSEVGIAMEAPMAILAAVFCADTYVQEIISKRAEIQRLYLMKKRIASVIKRLLIQAAVLLLMAATGYGLFFAFQKPFVHPGTENEVNQFPIFLGVIAITILFWGMLSNTLSILFRNMWAGIGGALLLWLTINSSGGEKYLGPWNLFSYTFRNMEDGGDISWLCGKILSICLCVIMLAVLPKIFKKRG